MGWPWFVIWVSLFQAIAAWGQSIGTGSDAKTSFDSDPHIRRIIHHFDFDERDDGNMEDLPMFWLPFRGQDFPRFSTARFDTTEGHEAASSFYLMHNGHNVAYRYAGQAIKVLPNCAYSISVWVRADRQQYVRPAVSCYFLDHEGIPIEGSQRFSALTDFDNNKAEWQQVRVYLPPGSAEAAYVGITLWVVQPEIWDPNPRTEHHIEYRDTLGGAWFDDIAVHRLPRVELHSDRIGNVFTLPEKPRLKIVISDNDGIGLQARLKVTTGSDPLFVWESPIEVDTSGDQSARIFEVPLDQPGHYSAQLDIFADEQQVSSKTLNFALLMSRSGRSDIRPRSFGFVLEELHPDTLAAETALILGSGVGAVKLPIQSRNLRQTDTAVLDTMLSELIRHRLGLTGTIVAPPIHWTSETEKYPPKLLDVLMDNPEGWGPVLAKVVAPYATVIRDWQIGSDSDMEIARDARLPQALARLRHEMEGVMTVPRFNVCEPINREPSPSRLPAERQTLIVPPGIQPEWLADHFVPFRDLGYDESSLFLESEHHSSRDPLSDLGSWARKLIYARFTGVDTLYVPALWNVQRTREGLITEPRDDYVVFNTLVRLIHDADPGHSIALPEGGTALVFNRGQDSTWVLWNQQTGTEGLDYTLQLGSAAQQFDIWGRSTPLRFTEDGRQMVRVSHLPTFVEGVESGPTDLRAMARFEPEHMQYSVGEHTHQLILKNTDREPLTGTAHIQAPESWEAKPSTLRINIGSGEEMAYPVMFRFAGNESAGTKFVNVRLDLQSPKPMVMELPLSLQLDIPDVEVWGYANLQGDRLILRHGVTNRSDQKLNFKTYATAPGRDRQSRNISALPPGGTVTQEFHFTNASELSGRIVRLSLKEVDGLRIHNLDLPVP